MWISISDYTYKIAVDEFGVYRGEVGGREYGVGRDVESGEEWVVGRCGSGMV